MLGLDTECFMYYRKYILQITRNLPNTDGTELQKRFAAISEAPGTLVCGMQRKAPPPPDSTMMARNLGFTLQNVESQVAFDTLKQNYELTGYPIAG